MKTGNRQNLFILSFTLLVMMLGYAMAMPLLPFYIEKFNVGGTELGWLMATYSLMQLICAPIWGALSDRVGRKPVLLIGVLGYAVSLLFFGLSTRYWMLFVARSLSGILSSATQPTALAYIGDNAPEEKRSKSMGQLGAVMGIGIIIGPLVGGQLSKNILALPFFFGSGLAFLALILVLLLLPESRPKSSRVREAATHNDSGSMNQSPSDDSTSIRAHPGNIYIQTIFSPAGILLLLTLIISFGMTNVQGMIGLYVVDKFAFDTGQVGTLWMVMGAMLIVAQGGLVGLLSRRFGNPAMIRIGLVGGALGFLLIHFAGGYLSVLAAMGGFMLALGIIGPALNSCLAGYASDRLGSLMGLNSAATNLGKVMGPLWAGFIYDRNIEYPLISGSTILAAGLLVSLFGLKKTKVKKEPESK